MNPVTLSIIGVLTLVVFVQAAMLGLAFLREWQELKRRVGALEERPENSRLTHRDTLNIENATAAVVKVLRDIENLEDYARNSLEWLGKVRGLTQDDDAE